MDPQWASYMCTDVKVMIYDRDGNVVNNSGKIARSVDQDCLTRTARKKK